MQNIDYNRAVELARELTDLDVPCSVVLKTPQGTGRIFGNANGFDLVSNVCTLSCYLAEVAIEGGMDDETLSDMFADIFAGAVKIVKEQLAKEMM